MWMAFFGWGQWPMKGIIDNGNDLGFRKTRRKSCVAERLLTCQKGVCSFELDICIWYVWALRLHLLFLLLVTSACVYKVANGLSDNFTPLFQQIRVCCSICYQVTTPANNLHLLALTSLTRCGWVVRRPSSYFGYTGFKIGPSIACSDRLFCGFAQSAWQISVHAPTIYVSPSPISRFLRAPQPYLDINLQVIQLLYVTYEPIKSTTWANRHIFKS